MDHVGNKKYSDDQIVENYNKCRSLTELAKKLGMKNANGNSGISLRKRITRLGLDLNRLYDKKNQFVDEIGNVYGSLTVLSQAESKPHSTGRNRVYWNCLCDKCGLIVQVYSHQLRHHLKMKMCGPCSRKLENFSELKMESTAYYGKLLGDKTRRGTKDITGSRWSTIRFGAIKRNLEFGITIEYLQSLLEKQKYKCAISGVQLVIETNYKKRSATTASLDRIDSSLGYVEGNLQWVHKDLNIMKLDMPLDKFLNWCRVVASYNVTKEN